jgi:hypothetical protein
MKSKLDRFTTVTVVIALVVVIGLICAVALVGSMGQTKEAILIAGMAWAGL